MEDVLLSKNEWKAIYVQVKESESGMEGLAIELVGTVEE